METGIIKESDSKINFDLFQWKITWRWIELFTKCVYQSKLLPAKTSQQYDKNRTREKTVVINRKLLPMLQANKYNLFYHTLANVEITLYEKWVDN